MIITFYLSVVIHEALTHDRNCRMSKKKVKPFNKIMLLDPWFHDHYIPFSCSQSWSDNSWQKLSYISEEESAKTCVWTVIITFHDHYIPFSCHEALHAELTTKIVIRRNFRRKKCKKEESAKEKKVKKRRKCKKKKVQKRRECKKLCLDCD